MALAETRLARVQGDRALLAAAGGADGLEAATDEVEEAYRTALRGQPHVARGPHRLAGLRPRAGPARAAGPAADRLVGAGPHRSGLRPALRRRPGSAGPPAGGAALLRHRGPGAAPRSGLAGGLRRRARPGRAGRRRPAAARAGADCAPGRRPSRCWRPGPGTAGGGARPAHGRQRRRRARIASPEPVVAYARLLRHLRGDARRPRPSPSARCARPASTPQVQALAMETELERDNLPGRPPLAVAAQGRVGPAAPAAGACAWRWPWRRTITRRWPPSWPPSRRRPAARRSGHRAAAAGPAGRRPPAGGRGAGGRALPATARAAGPRPRPGPGRRRSDRGARRWSRASARCACWSRRRATSARRPGAAGGWALAPATCACCRRRDRCCSSRPESRGQPGAARPATARAAAGRELRLRLESGPAGGAACGRSWRAGCGCPSWARLAAAARPGPTGRLATGPSCAPSASGIGWRRPSTWGSPAASRCGPSSSCGATHPSTASGWPGAAACCSS